LLALYYIGHLRSFGKPHHMSSLLLLKYGKKVMGPMRRKKERIKAIPALETN